MKDKILIVIGMGWAWMRDFGKYLAKHFTSRQRVIAALAVTGLLVGVSLLLFDSCENRKARKNQEKYEAEKERINGEVRKLEAELEKLKAQGAANEALIEANDRVRPEAAKRTRIVYREVKRQSDAINADRNRPVDTADGGADAPSVASLCARAAALKVARRP